MQEQLGRPGNTQKPYTEAVSGLAQTLPCQMPLQMPFPIQTMTPAWLSTRHKAYAEHQTLQVLQKHCKGQKTGGEAWPA